MIGLKFGLGEKEEDSLSRENIPAGAVANAWDLLYVTSQRLPPPLPKDDEAATREASRVCEKPTKVMGSFPNGFLAAGYMPF